VLGILQLNEAQTLVYTGALNRPNLRYAVTSKPASQQEVIGMIVEWIGRMHAGHKGIIYCLTRKESETVAESVMQTSQGGIRCAAYHSDMPDGEKKAVHRRWRQNEISVVVATIAFGILVIFLFCLLNFLRKGMGINSPNVRFVIHHTMSKSLEAYFQESGRAGRDQQPVLFNLYLSMPNTLIVGGLFVVVSRPGCHAYNCFGLWRI
jgi:ATP-dependent DNA helicase Q1